MAFTRAFGCDDLCRMSSTNMDPFTETYALGFYLGYISRWPALCAVQENASGRVSSYMIGKAEGRRKEWHGHISAVTVAPEYRRLGLARSLMDDLERTSDKNYKAFFG
jgi:N-terminal acetyltransferase B complex catalytic subunit